LHAQSSDWREFPCSFNQSGNCPAGSPPIHPHWQAAFTISNVFDRVYYQTLGSSPLNNWYGEPRAVPVRVDAKY
jgi:hypothetical protein